MSPPDTHVGEVGRVGEGPRRGRGPLTTRGLALATAVLLAACGTATARGGTGGQSLTVFAAASLVKVLPQIGRSFEASHPGLRLRYEFAGTDTLVTQIEQGAPADVFAGASARYGTRLASERLAGTPVPFATNRLVLIVPASNPAHIRSAGDLVQPLKLVVAAAAVPAGAYTREVLDHLNAVYGPGFSARVMRRVVSNEDDVEAVLSKVRLGEADAGFVYATDAKLAGSSVRVIDLPPAAQAVATYPAAVVEASGHRSLAGAFVAFLLTSAARSLLRAAGFGPPPGP